MREDAADAVIYLERRGGGKNEKFKENDHQNRRSAGHRRGRSGSGTDKFPFRLNWTLYGEHAPFFVARDKGFYREEGLEVEIQEGSGSTTVAQLVANASNPVAYVDAATMMRGVGAGMPIKAVGVTLQQSPMSFIYRADAARPTKISEIKGSRIAITAGDASLAIFTAFMGKLGMKVEDVQMITVANPAAKEQAVLSKQADALLGYFMDQGPRMQLQTGVKMGWTRLYDIAGISTLCSAIIVNNDWMKDAKNQDGLNASCARRSAAGSTRPSIPNEAAEIFMKAAPGLQRGDREARDRRHDDDHRHEAHRGKPMVWSATATGRTARSCCRSSPKMKEQADVAKYFTNSTCRGSLPAEEVVRVAPRPLRGRSAGRRFVQDREDDGRQRANRTSA